MDTDVLVVGAGPTGLMLANQLGRRGVRVLIVDRHAAPSRETKALGVQARTLEIYSALGLVEGALAIGKRAEGGNMWARGRKLARIPLGSIGRDLNPYPYLLILGQDDNERLMGERLRDWGIAVQWKSELVGLVQDDGQATATLTCPDGSTRNVTAAWIAGCDGAHSATRALCGIAFRGAPYEHVFFVADTQATGSMVPDEINVYLWQKGFHLFFPLRGPDHWRVVGILPPELRDREDLTFEDVVPSLRNEAGAGLSFQKCSWFSTYRIHHRRAERFRDRRCFLLGDAAHVHSPVGAQGMNTGLQDAYNLAWKLALVVSGRAGAAVLDSYAEERIPVADHLLRTTDRAFSLIVSDNALAGLFRTQVLARIVAFAMGRKRMQKFAFRMISQTGIRYRSSALSETLAGVPEDAPRAGDRLPWLRLRLAQGAATEDLYAYLDDTRFNLMLIGQPPPGGDASGLGDLMRVHSVPGDPVNDRELGQAKVPQPSFFLVRPDGHIGLAGVRMDAAALSRYVTERLHVAVKRA
jgi:2-polyprenyl-6-methoxyphenol hydroxylase-like FAD-dependent oxidoreductase